MKIGNPPWSKDEIIASIDEFSTIYSERPIKDNQGGMKAPHMFAVWFIAKKLAPDLIVESGIWKGQSTWLLEKACPEAELISIDLNLDRREYISSKAIYFDRDFSEQNWTQISGDQTLAFFDDHQNAYKRLQQCKWFGFRHIIFEDNYPAKRGDCYSLKKVLANAGFEPERSKKPLIPSEVSTKVLNKFATLSGINSSFTPQHEAVTVAPNDFDSLMLQKNLEIYYEFPPVCKTDRTRWGDEWNDESYPTPKPLLERLTKPSHDIFLDEAKSYTWICYTKLK